jgi:hypothetical protein
MSLKEYVFLKKFQAVKNTLSSLLCSCQEEAIYKMVMIVERLLL